MQQTVNHFRVTSYLREYEVCFMQTLAEAMSALFTDEPTFVLVDSEVYRLYPDCFALYPPEKLMRIEANEDNKSYLALVPVFEWLIRGNFRRNYNLLVVGGGVLQDIGSFVAHVLFRGVRWQYIPTTLLAQCDSCIGSKSSINMGAFKNQLGTFDPPARILIPSQVLNTLPPDALRSGLGEMIKLHALTGADAMASLESVLSSQGLTPASLEALVPDCLAIKKRYIEADEFDTGIRNLLNYGHTFGHGFESVTQYAIPHGIAVTLGMLTATFVSEQLGWLPSGSFHRERQWLRPYFTPYEKALSPTQLDAVMQALQRDKKNTGAAVNCILTRGYGAMEKTTLNAEETLRPLLRECLLAILG